MFPFSLKILEDASYVTVTSSFFGHGSPCTAYSNARSISWEHAVRLQGKDIRLARRSLMVPTNWQELQPDGYRARLV